ALLECGSSSARFSLPLFTGFIVSLHNDTCFHPSLSSSPSIDLPFDDRIDCSLTQHGGDMITVIEQRRELSLLTIDDPSFLVRCPKVQNLPERIPKISLNGARISSSTGSEIEREKE
ncbi:hypothetical protein PFISCL1PPCAC_15173, partial [Pristionchus fissidentatus]